MWRLVWAACFAPVAFTGVMLIAAEPERAGPAMVEGTVNSVRCYPPDKLELALGSGTNRTDLIVENSGGRSPALFSRIRATQIGSATGEPQPANRALTEQVPTLKQIHLLTGSLVPVVTNVAQLRRLEDSEERAECLVYLNGLVLAASPDGHWLAFQDDSGTAFLELDSGGRSLWPGQKIFLESNCTVEGSRVRLGNPPVVDNNGVHTMAERSGRIFLNAGRWPFRLSWFNFRDPHGLKVFYQGPHLPRQRIPDSALFHQETDPANGGGRWTHGLRYRCYEGSWVRVPNFNALLPAKAGISANFDTAVCSRATNVGVEFSGYVDVRRAGVYSFSTVSDDGSLLFINDRPPWIEVTGTNALPEPRVIVPGQTVGWNQPDKWAAVEGTVTFVSRQPGTLALEVSSEDGRMQVEIADGAGAAPLLLLHSDIRAVGICQSDYTADGESVAGTLRAPSLKQIEILAVPAERWTEHPVIPIGDLAAMKLSPNSKKIVQVRGIVRPHQPEEPLLVADQTGQVRVQTTQHPPPDNTPVEVLGQLSRAGTNVVLQCAFCREISLPAEASPKALPLLTTVGQIKRLTRREAQQGYPVKIRGVITTVLNHGFFIQDDTGSIYTRWQPAAREIPPRVGDRWKIEGTTFAEFAPNVRAHHAVRLGPGTMPEPKHPTWDELINGSLDTEYVEVQGIVTAVEANGVVLLTHGGKIRLQLPEIQPQVLKSYNGALIRVRGCVVPAKNAGNQQMRLGQLEFANASIAVDEPAPANPFALPLTHVSDLLSFNWQAGTLQRVKIEGQFLCERGGEYFMMDGHDGLRFISKSPVQLDAGDRIEVAGFPELGGPSPVLHEAIVRRIRPGSLPPAFPLPSDALVNRRYDSTRVRIQARLTSISRDRSDQVLDLQTGTRGFVARLKTSNGLLRDILPGSLLELTGVYAGQGGNLAAGRNIDSFELLLNSASAVRVLERPSWWTLRHTLTVVGALTLAVLVAAFWITLLRRQVEERSRQLATEIWRHEQTERRRELEEERARIARDLHDDLGATLTQIRFLSALESRDQLVPKNTRARLEQVSEKSREMVASLDEIVWAVNPANDTLPNLANYLCHFAEEFFRPTPIRCRLDVDDSLPPAALTSDMRHHLYLAVREALNNIAKHSQATEIWLRIQWREGELRISIEDNGRGFAPPAAAVAGDGLANMRRRLEKIGGRFECDALPGAGIACRFFLSLNSTPHGEAQSPA